LFTERRLVNFIYWRVIAIWHPKIPPFSIVKTNPKKKK
jgi:hypothetical protein